MSAPRKGPDLDALARGTVRGRHIFTLFGLGFFLCFALSYLVSRDVDPLFRSAWRDSLWGVFTFAFFAIVTLCVPELRRLFVELVRTASDASPPDVLLAIAVMLAWGLGASRMLFNYPIVLLDEDTGFTLLGLGQQGTPSPIQLLLGTFSMVVLAPVMEEIVFRGYLLNLWLANHRAWMAICGSSIVFGIWHFQNAPFATGMGFILAFVYLKHRSLLLCIALHALYNLLMNRLLLGQFFMQKDRATVSLLSSWSSEIVLAALFVPLFFAFWKRFRPQSAITS